MIIIPYYRIIDSYQEILKLKKIKTSFVSFEGEKALANKTDIKLLVFNLIFKENWL